ncbi:hypothetical protein EI94DRAFT_1702807 [Lactarius quietus]|nr:hypothetical protein EI94DRAFT_1702807 [Lactarius quietus]
MVAGVPLEFAEEVEVFILYGGGSVSVSIPSSGPADVGQRKDGENTWPPWDGTSTKEDEVGEQFQEISVAVVGLTDNKQALTMLVSSIQGKGRESGAGWWKRFRGLEGKCALHARCTYAESDKFCRK